MAMDLDLKIEKMLWSKARLILSMDKKTREKVLYRLCRQKLLSHIHAVTKSGWYYVDGTDKYSPYNSKQYVVFAIVLKDIVVQLAANFDDNEIYFTYYIPKQSAWYRWKNYDFKKRETNIKSSAIPVRGKMHVLENESKPCFGNMTDSCSSLQNGNNVLSGIPVYSGEKRENKVSITIDGINDLNEIKNKLIAVNIAVRAKTNSTNICKSLASNVGTVNLKFDNDTGETIYFVYYDGNQFHYCGKLS